MQELTRQLAEYIVDEAMSAEADEACMAAPAAGTATGSAACRRAWGRRRRGVPRSGAGASSSRATWQGTRARGGRDVRHGNERPQGAADSREDGRGTPLQGPGGRNRPEPQRRRGGAARARSLRLPHLQPEIFRRSNGGGTGNPYQTMTLEGWRVFPRTEKTSLGARDGPARLPVPAGSAPRPRQGRGGPQEDLGGLRRQ